MTDPTDLDELASAYLDGEATEEERARVEADPGLLARVEQLRAVAAAVGSGYPPLDEARATAQRRRAIVAGTDAVPIAPRAPARRHRMTWLPAPAVAAAVIIALVVAGVWLIGSAGSSSDDSSASSSGGGATSGNDQAPASSTTSPVSPESKHLSALTDLGSFASRESLTAALEQVDDVTTFDNDRSPATTSESTSALDSTIPRCESVVKAGQSDLSDALAVARATLDGTAVLVYSNPVRGSSDPAVTQLTVVDAADCRVLFAVQR